MASTAAWMGAQNWQVPESPWAAFEEVARLPSDPGAKRFLTRREALASLPPDLAATFMTQVTCALPALRARQGKGAPEVEAAICRWCVGLALFEEVYRAGFVALPALSLGPHRERRGITRDDPPCLGSRNLSS